MYQDKLIDGKALSISIKASLTTEVASFKSAGFRSPHLAAVLVGDDGASITYVNSKVADCHEVGFESTLIRLGQNTSMEELLDQVYALNQNDAIDGFIVQLPLPSHLNEQLIIESIDPGKDVDGFHPVNVGRMALGLPSFKPATPNGIIQLLDHYKVKTDGAHCVIAGRSNIVGTPLSLMLSRKATPGNCTVTLCHSKTRDFAKYTRMADIVVMALGIPEFLKADMVKEGVVIIDVGTTRMPSEATRSGFKLFGDVDFNEVAPKASLITPVPGGVGPMTRTALLQNTLKAFKIKHNLS